MSRRYTRLAGLVISALAFILVLAGIAGVSRNLASAAGNQYKILGWNDLGMHCYNRDFSDLAVLPPFNTLWVQVVKQGDPPEIVTSGITIRYFYQDNTYSVGKTNFWDYAQPLFGVSLPPNTGLKGKGLSGTMDLQTNYFVAVGIPVTEYSDSAPTVPQPYQLATVVVTDSITGVELARTQIVTPVSSEMRCDNCHGDHGPANPGIATGKVETNILTFHDRENGTNLMSNRPVLCAKCHGSNALGILGNPNLKNLSNAMHETHSEAVSNTLDGCYNCHPGPQTHCLRDVMSVKQGMTCINCHGGMNNVASNPTPWLKEPRCDNCHDSNRYGLNQPLYRFSIGHGGLYCEACHDSTHAIAPSREANDAIKFIALQGVNGPIQTCTVCHITAPNGQSPHDVPGTIFADVPVSYWALSWIERVYKAGITAGCSTNPLNFCPENTVTRAQMAVFLLRGIHGASYNPPAASGLVFNDAPATYWAAAWIEQLALEGITSGCGGGNFCPEQPVSRAQMALFLLRAKHGPSYKPPTASGTMYNDVPASHWAAAWIEQLTTEGITSGCGASTYCPDQSVTRAQMAVFLVRTFGLP